MGGVGWAGMEQGTLGLAPGVGIGSQGRGKKDRGGSWAGRKRSCDLGAGSGRGDGSGAEQRHGAVLGRGKGAVVWLSGPRGRRLGSETQGRGQGRF